MEKVKAMKLPGFGIKTAKAPPLPEIEEPALMPDPDDKHVKVRKRRLASAARQRSGRASTQNTAPELGTVLG